MIYCLEGDITHIDLPWISLMTPGGVGYEIECTQSLLDVCQLNMRKRIHTHLTVREDAQLLYGFHSVEERELFRTLIKVSGVGPKMAIGILSGLSVDELILAIQQKTPKTLLRCKGVGHKVAEKIIVECQNRFANWHITAIQPQGGQHDAVAALQALGYRQQLVEPLAQKAAQTGLVQTADIVKYVLSELQPQ